VEENLPAVVAENQHAQDIAFDYELSRTTHRDLLEQGQESLTDLLKVAKESQHPRAYEVAANMLNTLSNMTDKLMALHEKRKALDGTKGQSQQTVNVDKAVFVGSTADLLKQIKEKQ
jgi:SNF2 family DNA or RNA helicase